MKSATRSRRSSIGISICPRLMVALGPARGGGVGLKVLEGDSRPGRSGQDLQVVVKEEQDDDLAVFFCLDLVFRPEGLQQCRGASRR